MLDIFIFSAAVVMPLVAAIYLERLQDRFVVVALPALLVLLMIHGNGESLRFWLWLASIAIPLLLTFMHALRAPGSRRMAKVVAFRTTMCCASIAIWWTLFVAWASLSHNPQSVYCDPGPPAQGHNIFFSGSGDCRIILETWLPFVIANFAIAFLGLGGIISLVVLVLAVLSRHHARRLSSVSVSANSASGGETGSIS